MGYRPTTRRGAMRKRHFPSGIGNRGLRSRDMLRNSGNLDDRRRAQRQTGERYFARGADLAYPRKPASGAEDQVAYPRHDEAARIWTRDKLDAATKDELLELASIANVRMAKRWGKGKMVDKLDDHFSKLR
jgi:hypothetical protein